MAKYTMELRRVSIFYGEDVVKSWFKSYNLSNYLTDDEIEVINDRGTWNKDRLADKIYNHYYMREIGFETPALFKHYVLSTMDEIMEKYLPLIYSASIEYNPLVNVDYTETFNRNSSGTNTSTETGSGASSNQNTVNSSGLTVNSDTPQGQISKSAILGGSYASSTSAGENTTSNNDSASYNNSISKNDTNSGLESYTKKIKGNSGVSATAQAMIKQYRANIIAIDKAIIDELNTLFMGIY